MRKRGPAPHRRAAGSTRRWSRRRAESPCAWRTSRCTQASLTGQERGQGGLTCLAAGRPPSAGKRAREALSVQCCVDQRGDDVHPRILEVVAVGRLLDLELPVLVDELIEETVHPHELAVALVALTGRPLEVLPPVVLLLHPLAGVTADEGDDGAAVAVVDRPLPGDEVAPVPLRPKGGDELILVELPVREDRELVVGDEEALVGEPRVVVVAAVARIREAVGRELLGDGGVDASEVVRIEAGDAGEHRGESPGFGDLLVQRGGKAASSRGEVCRA